MAVRSIKKETPKRVEKIRKALKSLGKYHYIADYIKMYPEDQDPAGVNRVRNVLAGVVTDLNTVEKLEKFIDKLQLAHAAKSRRRNGSNTK